ncbi:unnamed protein product [Adineta steineri]|uniref:Uncharacterized protein n=1 Tax=Adineta steineri TaxID=433720 RepID=A0A819P361_9BILA|nr:unnamed protein product [Adineta steineri]CAF1488914.1 unnamed protein product [Adineta steineri]CAF4003725.1 unnamed protein product [Adineta steineri]CAF4173011.1 unnamed protein product [Adineta steineri]
MSVEEKNMTQEIQDITFGIESALINCYSYLQWQFSNGILKGFNGDVANEYIYEYHPDSDNTQVIRLVFKEKLEPKSDTLESIIDKFNRIEVVRLAFPTRSIDNLPTDWLFTIEKTNVIRQLPMDIVIIPISLDENSRLRMSLQINNINIYGKNKLTNEQILFDSIQNGNAKINLDLTIQNSN